MFSSLEIFQTSHAMARHAGSRQALTAANMANADTPGYRAQSMASFADSYTANPASDMRATRAGHLGSGALFTPPDIQFTDAESSPNGNYDGSNVNLLIEIADAREAQRSYEANLKLFDQVRQMSTSLMDILRK